MDNKVCGNLQIQLLFRPQFHFVWAPVLAEFLDVLTHCIISLSLFAFQQSFICGRECTHNCVSKLGAHRESSVAVGFPPLVLVITFMQLSSPFHAYVGGTIPYRGNTLKRESITCRVLKYKSSYVYCYVEVSRILRSCMITVHGVRSRLVFPHVIRVIIGSCHKSNNDRKHHSMRFREERVHMRRKQNKMLVMGSGVNWVARGRNCPWIPEIACRKRS